MTNAESKPMRLSCAWCSTVIRDEGDGPMSHGICPVCMVRLVDELRELKVDPRSLAHTPGGRALHAELQVASAILSEG